MNLDETLALLKRIAAADQRTIGESDIEFWADVLPGWVELPDALSAVAIHYRSSRFRIMPSDVLGGAKRARADRLGYALQENL